MTSSIELLGNQVIIKTQIKKKHKTTINCWIEYKQIPILKPKTIHKLKYSLDLKLELTSLQIDRTLYTTTFV